ncbi:MAG: M56 family metallopeptidase [Terriglobia bacterium]|jgi:beta-lactamase regulating signal transducer with metallopeptidase domain
MIDSTSHLCALLLRGLAEPALRALALAVLAGLLLAAARVKDAALRMAVWTAVLYAALAMPFLARVAPVVRLPMPDLLATRSVPSPAPTIGPAPSRIRVLVSRSPVRVPAAATPAAEIHSPKPAASSWTFSWPLVVAVCYLLISGILLAQVAVGFLFSRRVKLSSRPVGDRRVLAALLNQSTRGGISTAPELAESPVVAVPVTLGVWHPVILFPTAWREWSEEKLQAVLAHELSHVVRRDALTRALAALHRSVFWFSPLAWWLEGHLAALAEQASDDAALSTVADRVFYAKVLLGFYQDLQGAVGRVRWEGVAMTSGKQAQRRVERILDSSRRLSGGLRKPAWVALALMAAPVIYLLAGAQPVSANKLHTDGARVPAAALTSLAAGPVWAEMQAPPPIPSAPGAPAAPAAPRPAPAPAPRAPAPPRPAVSEWKYGDSGEPWMFTSGEDFIMGGYWRDIEVEPLKALRRESNADFIWFRRNGKAYLIRDAATVQQAKSYWAPQEALGKQQEELGRQQEALGDQQEELGRQMEQVRVEVPDLRAELQKVQAQLDQLHKRGATQEELGDLQGALGDLQGKLGEIQGKAGEKQGEIGAKQGELGARQGKLGEQQGKLGEEQGRLAEEATRKMKGLLDNALAKGLAQPE